MPGQPYGHDCENPFPYERKEPEPAPKPEPEEAEESDANMFGIGFVAKIFERGVEWVRWQESQEMFRYSNGEPIVPHRTNPPKSTYGYRKYSLEQISEMADSLFRAKKLTVTEHRVIKTRIEAFRLGRRGA